MVRFTEERYDVSKCVRIVNPRQCSLYMKHGVFPIDVYPGKDDILVFVFISEQTQELYKKWINHDLH